MPKERSWHVDIFSIGYQWNRTLFGHGRCPNPSCDSPEIVGIARQEVLAAVEQGQASAYSVHDRHAVCEPEVADEREVAIVVNAVFRERQAEPRGSAPGHSLLARRAYNSFSCFASSFGCVRSAVSGQLIASMTTGTWAQAVALERTILVTSPSMSTVERFLRPDALDAIV